MWSPTAPATASMPLPSACYDAPQSTSGHASPITWWEIENRGFNDGKNRYGMEHICHHEPNSILIVWLLIALALVIERLYRLRYLHRGNHAIRSAMELSDYLWLNLVSGCPPDTG